MAPPGVGVGLTLPPTPLPYPFGGAEVCSVDHATGCGGTVTDGGVPQLLKSVVNVATAAPVATVDTYVMGRSEPFATSRYPVPAGTPFNGGTLPAIRVAEAPPAMVILVAEMGTKLICVDWLLEVIPG